MRVSQALAAAVALACSLASATSLADDSDRHGVYLELPVLDVPYNLRGGAALGMGQSLWLTSDVYLAAHYGVGLAIDPYEGTTFERVAGRVAVLAADFAIGRLPGGAHWQAAEWSRATLGNREISSHNQALALRLFDPMKNVSEVSDQELATLKREHPAEMVRMATAELEANYELATNLEKIDFFYRTSTWNTGLLWGLYIAGSYRQGVCASTRSSSTIDDANRDEGGSAQRESAFGLGCTSSVYDLFHPSDPYAARGQLSSGAVNRYVRYEDMSYAEQRYARRMFYLSLTNFLDPRLVGIEAFTIETARGAPWRWNANVRHMPTSFGHVADVDVFFQRYDYNLFFTLHSYFNREHYFPGVTAEALRFPLDMVIGLPVNLTGRLGAWLQPKDQAFETSRVQLGGLAGLKLGYGGWRQLEPYVEVEAKSAGWVAGSPFLSSNVSGRLGLVAPLL